MRSYSVNSPQAAARIVALVVPAGGDTQRAEIECLGHLTVHGQRGSAQQESYALLDSFCEDLLSIDQLKWADARPVDERTLAHRMGCPCRHGAASERGRPRRDSSGLHVASMHLIATLN